MKDIPVWYMMSLAVWLVSCTTEDIYETQDSPSRMVRALFSPTGLGDLSYNDDILRGIMRAKTERGFQLQYESPQDMDAALTAMREWQSKGNAEGCYIILVGSQYRKIASCLHPSEKGSDRLFFESSDNDLHYPVFRFCGYGVSFWAGMAAHDLTKADSAAFIGGQRGEQFIEECADGFRDGYLYAGGKDVSAMYLADNSDGFNMPTRAYDMADSIYRTIPFIYMVAGGSNNGLYLYLREHPEVKGYTNGVDSDQSDYCDRIIGSMIKETGACVENYIINWLDDKDIPFRNTFGLHSGKIYFKLSQPYLPLLEDMVNNYMQQAMDKEDEYNKNHIQ